jgi:2-methylcitrate dehydratase
LRNTDQVLGQIVDYAVAFDAAELTDEVLTATLHHLVDTVAVAIAGRSAEPAEMAGRLARAVRAENGATVIGLDLLTTPELAAFANTIMVRTYDWNDGMQARGGGHPSDMVPGILAVGEVTRAAGIEVLTAMALAYELLGGLGAKVPVGDLGYDQGTFMAPAVALSVGKLLGLNGTQLANAASLAVTVNLPLGVSRWGPLSMMKGCATAFAVRSAVFAAMLAGEGFTASSEPFEGTYGLQHVLGPIEPTLPVLPGGPRVVQMSHQKPVPAETQALGLLDLVPAIREWTDIDDITDIDIEVSAHVAEHIGDPAKYDPKTRETADHSLPYMLAVALVDGRITLDSYGDERIADPALRPLMRKIVIRPNDEFTAQRERELHGVTRPTPARITIRTTDGRVFTERVNYYRGHPRNPLTRTDIDAKLTAICAPRMASEQTELIRRTWWDLDRADDVSTAMATLRSW